MDREQEENEEEEEEDEDEGKEEKEGGRAIADEIRATLVDHVINHGLTMREAGLRVQLNLCSNLQKWEQVCNYLMTILALQWCTVKYVWLHNIA